MKLTASPCQWTTWKQCFAVTVRSRPRRTHSVVKLRPSCHTLHTSLQQDFRKEGGEERHEIGDGINRIRSRWKTKIALKGTPPILNQVNLDVTCLVVKVVLCSCIMDSVGCSVFRALIFLSKVQQLYVSALLNCWKYQFVWATTQCGLELM